MKRSKLAIELKGDDIH